MGFVYRGLGMIVAAIDALATLLVGREGHFWTTRSAPADAVMAQGTGERNAEWRAPSRCGASSPVFAGANLLR